MNLLAGSTFKIASEGPAAAYAGWLLRSLGGTVDHQTRLAEDGLGLFLGQGARYVREFDFTSDSNEIWITDVPVTEGSRAELTALSGANRAFLRHKKLPTPGVAKQPLRRFS